MALGTILPYTIAFKIVTVIGVVMMPAAVWAWGKLSDFPKPVPALMAAATVPFLFDKYFSIWGGNIASTLAGEFSFSIALSIGFVFLGVFTRGLKTGRHRGLAAVLLMMTGLCHIIPTFFVLAVALVILLLRLEQRAIILGAISVVAGVLIYQLPQPGTAHHGYLAAGIGLVGILAVIGVFERERLLYAATVGVVGGALAAFWVVPFGLRNPFATNMGWERTNHYAQSLFPFLAPKGDALNSGTQHLPWVVGLAGMAVVIGLWNRRTDILTVTAMAISMALAFRLAPVGALWNARLLPFWYLLLYLLAAFAVAEIFKGISWLFAELAGEEVTAVNAIAPLLGLLVVLLNVGSHLGMTDRFAGNGIAHSLAKTFLPSSKDANYVTSWAEWNYKGYDYKEPDGTYSKSRGQEYHDVVARMADIGKNQGCGRAMWEYEPEEDQMGTPMALMLLPHWTEGCIGSMEGLFFESASSTPWHFINQSELSKTPSRAMRDLSYPDLNVAQGIQHLQLMGVRYYMAINPDTQAQADTNPDLSLLTTIGPYTVTYNSVPQQRTWKVYEVAGSETVTGLSYEPVVMKGITDRQTSFLKASEGWYLDPTRWDVPLATSGPASWARVDGADPVPPRKDVHQAVVNNIRTTDNGISFDVDQPGTPVLVKTSYFPNWKASGGKGPWRVTPNLMVVIPTSTHVSMKYADTNVDYLGWIVTLLGLGALVVLWRRGPARFPTPVVSASAGAPPVDDGTLAAASWPYAYAGAGRAAATDPFGRIAGAGDVPPPVQVDYPDFDPVPVGAAWSGNASGPPGNGNRNGHHPPASGDAGDGAPMRTMEHQIAVALDEGRYSDGETPDFHGYYDTDALPMVGEPRHLDIASTAEVAPESPAGPGPDPEPQAP